VAICIDPTLPLYAQLKARLSAQIANGELRPMQKLPSERELASQWQVSRMTVRQALGLLAQEGLTYSRPGKGIFVAAPRSELQLVFSLTGYGERTPEFSGALTSRVLKTGLVSARSELMALFGLVAPEELVCVERLRCLSEVPLAHQVLYFLHRLCPGLLDKDLSVPGSLTDHVRALYQLRGVRVEQTISARAATGSDARHLIVSEADPVLCLERTSFLDDGSVLEYSRSIYRGDGLTLHLSLDISHTTVSR
jgi:GntR family transcriptional regulator